jgi:polyisoprenoid-binding protein YceI
MKLKSLFLILAIHAFLVSCGGKEEKKAGGSADLSGTYIVNTDSSQLNWKGEMLKLYSHSGVLKLTEGVFTIEGNEIKSGTFTADLLSISPTDEGYNPESPKEKLVGHLQSADFFATDSFPSATFAIKKMEGNTIKGDLTLRGKTNEEKVTDVVLEQAGDQVKATGKLVFNRQKYGVSFKMPVQDKVLSDDIEVGVFLIGKKKE